MSPLACPADTSISGTAANRRTPRSTSSATASPSGGGDSSMKPPATGSSGWRRPSSRTKSRNASAPASSRVPCPAMSRAGGGVVTISPSEANRRTDRRTEWGGTAGRSARPRRPPNRPSRTRCSRRAVRSPAARPWTRPPPTKPTGSPTTSAGEASRVSSSSSAVGAQPITQSAPGPTCSYASRMACAERVSPGPATASFSRHTVRRRVIPAATISTSTATGAPACSAACALTSSPSSMTRSDAYSRSAAEWMTRSTTARVSGGKCEVSSRARSRRKDSCSMGCTTRLTSAPPGTTSPASGSRAASPCARRSPGSRCCPPSRPSSCRPSPGPEP